MSRLVAGGTVTVTDNTFSINYAGGAGGGFPRVINGAIDIGAYEK